MRLCYFYLILALIACELLGFLHFVVMIALGLGLLWLFFKTAGYAVRGVWWLICRLLDALVYIAVGPFEWRD